MPPRRITRVAVMYDDGGAEEWIGTGSANVIPNMVCENDRATTPPPHTWDEVSITLRIDGPATAVRPFGIPTDPPTDPDHPHTDAVFNGGI